MSNLRFSVQIHVTNPGAVPELEARISDLSPAFEAIFEQWVQLNAQKFELSSGKESSGADVFGEFWHELTKPYMKQKRQEGFPDWLMVRTGALAKALEDPNSLFQKFEAQEAVFGTPNDPDLSDIIRWQAGERQNHRQVIFLGLPDMNAIRRILGDYLSMGGKFSQIRNQKAIENMNLRNETAMMDAEFMDVAS